jgi:adenylate cyclase
MTLLRRFPVPGMFGLAVLLVLLTIWTLSPVAHLALRERTFDHLLPLLPQGPLTTPLTGPHVVIVDIDRAAVARFGEWPWPRTQLAQLVDAAASAQPAVVGLDMLLAGPDRFAPDRFATDGNAVLARALARTSAVLGFVLEPGAGAQDLPATPILARGPVLLNDLWRAHGVAGPAPELVAVAQGLGALAVAADADGPIRRVPLLLQAGGVVRPGLAVEVVRLAQQAGALLVDGDAVLRIGAIDVPLGSDATLRLIGGPQARSLPALRVLEDAATRGSLSGQIVLIGSSAPELGGLRATPGSPVTPSVSIQAAAVEAMLRGPVFVRPAWAHWVEPLAALVLGLACLLLAGLLRPAAATLFAAALCLGWAGSAFAAAPGLSLLLDPAGPAILAAAAFASAMLVRFVRDEWQARLLRLSFEQHLAPEVVRRIAADPAALRLRGELREVTALFTDIEGFTSMTERADPADLVALLDAYFDATTRIVTDHGGMIDKIVGDSIHAIYNAPFEIADHAGRAIASGLALLVASEEVRRSPLGQRLQLGRTRIGIETGPAIVGDVGGSRKLDYTAHGNAVNAAARLEAANKDLGSSICIGPGTAARVDPAALRQIGSLTLRGQSSPIAVYTPVALSVSA